MQVDAVYGDLEGLMRETHPDRVITIRTLNEVKTDQFSAQLAVTKLLTVVIGLLVLVTALGIVGPDIILGYPENSSNRHASSARCFQRRHHSILSGGKLDDHPASGSSLASS